MHHTIHEDNQDVRTDAWGLVDFYLKPIAPFLQQEGVTEICINNYQDIYIERFGRMERVPATFDSEQHLQTLVKQISNALGQVSDAETHPILDARLIDGSRVCAVLYPTSPRGTCITIRVFPRIRITADKLVEYGSLTPDMLEFLRVAILVRGNGLVSGGTGSGKTTLLNVLSSFVPKKDRVLTVEDTKELQVDVENLVALEAPQKRKLGHDYQHVDMAFLIRTTLRMKPTRIIVGEVRDGNAATAFLYAINTGHSGTCSTIHANNPEDALTRMQTLVAGDGKLPFEVVREQVRCNLHFVVQAQDTPQHGRRIIAITELRHGQTVVLWSWDYIAGKHVAHAENIRTSVLLEQAQIYGVETSLLSTFKKAD